ncbi:MAG: hypothetical protein D6746_00580 [Bacteroidetes bacterium]|nr:MAG: hypothetical protein D6746_00580 [Bacteroidota bacterium]
MWDVALVNRPYKFLDPQTFDKRRATGLHLISGNVYYTVTNDPVPATDDTVEPKAYLQIYPYPASTTTLRGLYRKQEEDLVADGDIPVIPREHRLALLYIAEWLLAVKLKQPPDVVRNYETKAQSAIVELDKMYTFSEEDPEDLTLQRADVFGPLEYDFPI